MDSLAEFTQQANALKTNLVDEALSILRKTVVFAFERVIEESDVAVDTGRYRASWRIAIGAPVEDTGAEKGPNPIPDALSIAGAVADEMKLGDTVFISNNVGFGETQKGRSYAFFIEYGHGYRKGDQKTSAATGGAEGEYYEARLVAEKTQIAAESLLADLIAEFNARRL